MKTPSDINNDEENDGENGATFHSLSSTDIEPNRLFILFLMMEIPKNPISKKIRGKLEGISSSKMENETSFILVIEQSELLHYIYLT